MNSTFTDLIMSKIIHGTKTKTNRDPVPLKTFCKINVGINLELIQVMLVTLVANH